MWLLGATPADLNLSDYGLLGAALASAVSAVVYLARTQLKRESERSDRLEKELREANQLTMSIFEKALPVLSASTAAVEAAADLQQRVHDLLERLLEAQRRSG